MRNVRSSHFCCIITTEYELAIHGERLRRAVTTPPVRINARCNLSFTLEGIQKGRVASKANVRLRVKNAANIKSWHSNWKVDQRRVARNERIRCPIVVPDVRSNGPSRVALITTSGGHIKIDRSRRRFRRIVKASSDGLALSFGGSVDTDGLSCVVHPSIIEKAWQMMISTTS